MRTYPVPLELKGEDTLLGDYLSGRQLLYLGAGLGAGVASGAALWALMRLLGVSDALAVSIGVLPLPFTLGAAAVLAFVPAGFMGLPGPEMESSPDPFDPPIRLDQWLKLLRAFNAKAKHLPYRRRNYVQLPPLIFGPHGARGKGR